MNNDRYQRHSLIDWFSQDVVKTSSFAVIGCGAVGNEVAKNLALLGVGRIDLYDFDKIEIHNLTRSVLFRESDVGFYKADVAGKRIKDLDPNIEVNTYNGNFWDLLSLDQAKSYSGVICCVDNFEARIKLNQICLITGTNFINTGIDSKFGQIEVFPFGAGKHAACYECNLPNTVYERMQNRYSCGWLKKISFIERKIPTTIVTSSLTGSLAVANALNLLRDVQHDAKRIMIDTFTGSSTVSIMERSAACPACASLGNDISIMQCGAKINSQFSLPTNKDIHVITSDPILVSYRCTECNPDELDATIVFQRAAKYDSSFAICKTCMNESVDITIKDIFSIDELLSNFLGLDIPSKFIRYDNENLTTIIEVE